MKNNHQKQLLILFISILITINSQYVDIHTTLLKTLEPIGGVKLDATQTYVQPVVASAETGAPGMIAISEILDDSILDNKFVKVTLSTVTEHVQQIRQIPYQKFLIIFFESFAAKIDIQVAYQCGQDNNVSPGDCTLNTFDRLDYETGYEPLYVEVLQEDTEMVVIFEQSANAQNSKLRFINYETLQFTPLEQSYTSAIQDMIAYKLQGTTIITIAQGVDVKSYTKTGLQNNPRGSRTLTGQVLESLAYVANQEAILASDTHGVMKLLDAKLQGLDVVEDAPTQVQRVEYLRPILNTNLVILVGANYQKVAILDTTIGSSSIVKTVNHGSIVGEKAYYLKGTGYIVYQDEGNPVPLQYRYKLTRICDDSTNDHLGIRSGVCQTCPQEPERYFRACTDCPDNHSFDYLTCKESDCLSNCPICKASNCVAPKIFTPPNGENECTCVDPPQPTEPEPTQPEPTEPEPEPQPVICVDGEWKDEPNNQCLPCYEGCPKCEGPLNTDCILIQQPKAKDESSIPYPIQIVIGVVIIYIVCAIVTIVLKKVKQSKIPYQGLDQSSQQSFEDLQNNTQKRRVVNPNKILPDPQFPVIHESEQEYYNSNIKPSNQMGTNNFNQQQQRATHSNGFQNPPHTPNSYRNQSHRQQVPHNNISNQQFLDPYNNNNNQQDYNDNQSYRPQSNHYDNQGDEYQQRPTSNNKKFNSGTRLQPLNKVQINQH